MKIIMKAILFIVLCVYLMILTKLILFKYVMISDIDDHFKFIFEEVYWNSHNFVPFETIKTYLFYANNLNPNIRISNLAGNVIGFIPFGFLLPLIWRSFRSFTRITIAAFCLSLTFELLQLFFRFGSFDVDDLILNTAGGMIGYAPFMFIGLYMGQKRGKTKK